MAQIKKIVKPGDAVRGAKVGLAALDKDGLVKSFPIPANSTGKYLGIDVSNNPGWFNVPALPAWDPISDMGKILKITNIGPEWQNEPKIYRHSISVQTRNPDGDDLATMWFTFYCSTSQEFTSMYQLYFYISEEIGNFYIPCSGDFIIIYTPGDPSSDYDAFQANMISCRDVDPNRLNIHYPNIYTDTHNKYIIGANMSPFNFVEGQPSSSNESIVSEFVDDVTPV